MKSIFSLRPGILNREEDEDQRDEPPRPRKERGARIEGEGVMTAAFGFAIVVLATISLQIFLAKLFPTSKICIMLHI